MHSALRMLLSVLFLIAYLYEDGLIDGDLAAAIYAASEQI